MVFDQEGQIADNVYWLVSPEIPVFLITGPTPAVLDAGFSCLGEHYVQSIKEILGPRPPEYCLLSHMHFDHCGAVSVFKHHFPELKVCCSPLGQNLLHKPKAWQLIQDLNQAAQDMLQKQGFDITDPAKSEPFTVHSTLYEGQILQLAPQLSLQVLETPGHTRDSLSFYLQEQGILFCAEAAGIPNKQGYISTECLSDYNAYLNSLLRLSSLQPEMICLGHNRVLSGRDARQYLENALQQAKDFKEWVLELMQVENRDLERIKARIKQIEFDQLPGPKQPEPAYLLNLEARVNAVLASGHTQSEMAMTNC